MHYVWTGLLGIIALLWFIQGMRVFSGMASIPRFSEAPPLSDADCPSVSILIPARHEGMNLRRVLPTILAQDYPHYEVIVVDDRSRDDTSQVLDDFARKNRDLKVIHLAELPEGWLGKTYALSVAYQHSTGDWLLFTDADIWFGPDVLRRALSLVKEQQWDHLTSMPELEVAGFWETTALSFWSFTVIVWLEGQPINQQRSRRYAGFGAFQLLRRDAYESIGTHRRLAMEVVDDFKLARLVKESGFLSGTVLNQGKLRLRYRQGLGHLVRNRTKNTFAACGFRISLTALEMLRLATLNMVPFLVLSFATGVLRTMAALSVVTVLALHARTARRCGVSWLFAFTHPALQSLYTLCCVRQLLRSGMAGSIGATIFIRFMNSAEVGCE
jgi:glycosyltransferase involved in cell wall biosynthesis